MALTHVSGLITIDRSKLPNDPTLSGQALHIERLFRIAGGAKKFAAARQPASHMATLG